jgi:hypothetical protein
MLARQQWKCAAGFSAFSKCSTRTQTLWVQLQVYHQWPYLTCPSVPVATLTYPVGAWTVQTTLCTGSASYDTSILNAKLGY